MVSGQTIEFVFDNVHVFDWYDGIARAIGIQQQEFYLIMLAAWDINKSRKAYVLVNLDKAIAKEIEKHTLENDDIKTKASRWNTINLALETYLNNYSGIVYLTFEEPQLGEPLSLQAINSMHLQKLLEYSIEKTLSPEAIDFWFSVD
jgi:hypothetical protein